MSGWKFLGGIIVFITGFLIINLILWVCCNIVDTYPDFVAGVGFTALAIGFIKALVWLSKGDN